MLTCKNWLEYIESANMLFIKRIYGKIKWFVLSRIKIVRGAKVYGVRYVFDARYRDIIRRTLRNRRIRLKERKRYGILGRQYYFKILVSKYGRKCGWCGARGRNVKLTIDHIVPISKRGSRAIKNMCILCVECHKVKTDTIDKRIPMKSGVEPSAIDMVSQQE